MMITKVKSKTVRLSCIILDNVYGRLFILMNLYHTVEKILFKVLPLCAIGKGHYDASQCKEIKFCHYCQKMYTEQTVIKC